MKANEIIARIYNGIYDEKLKDIYVDESKIDYEKDRYRKAIEHYIEQFGTGDVEIYSAPGRSEIGGNHTDHQNGEVLAAAINHDTIAVVKKTDEPSVKIVSEGYALVTISLDDLQKRAEEEGTTAGLIRGVLAKIKKNGHNIGGFQAYMTSDVLIGAGLSSSASFETIVGTVVSYLYNEGKISPIEIAMIGQYAENIYFGKPCGLMDQMACSVGSLSHINFANPEAPEVERLTFDLNARGYSLCITDTKGSHADLTADYAAIPAEMKQVAAFFGREVLGQVSKEEILKHLPQIREQVGDRGALRALHFVCENERVKREVAALQQDHLEEFLMNVKESGDSSYKYLQNVYVCHDIRHQNMSVALAMSDILLAGRGVSRVHGGGFAGTIQAFVPNDLVNRYQSEMEKIFGAGACNVLKIRKYGGIKVL